MTDRYQVDDVVLEKLNDGRIAFHGWDREADEAAEALGFEPSTPLLLWQQMKTKSLEQALIHMCLRGRLEAVKALVWLGADITSNEYAAFRFAATRDNTELTVYLLELGADLGSLSGTERQVMIFGGHTASIKLLLPLGTFDEDLEHWIDEAKRYRRPEIERLLKKRKRQVAA